MRGVLGARLQVWSRVGREHLEGLSVLSSCFCFLGLPSALLSCPAFVESPARNAVVVPSIYLAET